MTRVESSRSPVISQKVTTFPSFSSSNNALQSLGSRKLLAAHRGQFTDLGAKKMIQRQEKEESILRSESLAWEATQSALPASTRTGPAIPRRRASLRQLASRPPSVPLSTAQRAEEPSLQRPRSVCGFIPTTRFERGQNNYRDSNRTVLSPICTQPSPGSPSPSRIPQKIESPSTPTPSGRMAPVRSKVAAINNGQVRKSPSMRSVASVPPFTAPSAAAAMERQRTIVKPLCRDKITGSSIRERGRETGLMGLTHVDMGTECWKPNVRGRMTGKVDVNQEVTVAIEDDKTPSLFGTLKGKENVRGWGWSGWWP